MKWTWTINIVTVVCDLNKVGLKALIYCHHNSWCEMGWNLGFKTEYQLPYFHE